MKLVVTIFVLLVTPIILMSSLFILDEGRQAIITEFGKPVSGPIVKAGVHIKRPFLQEVRYVDKRILSWDGYPNQIVTKDKKYIFVDTTARWKIVDVLKFIQTVKNENGAKGKLDAILDAATRDVITAHILVEAVRDSNKILEVVAAKKKEIQNQIAKGVTANEEEITGEIEKITVGREQLSEMIKKNAEKELVEFGIELIDVQLRRISYEKSVEKKVYERMISERGRIAEKIRSIGQGEKAKIEGRLGRDLEKIQSEAYKRAEEIKGIAEAKAIAIFAKSLSKGPEFYEFNKTLESYKEVLNENVKFIMSSDSDYLKLIKKIK
ncbi:MAG: protease modulator HflC [Halobacteriovoraceae bacterium]|nr:protease modulator HflC [Halobacteriovoraceae bacterium]